MANNQAKQDVRNIVSGKDAQIYITGTNGIAIYMGEVETFQAQMSITNATYQPLGTAQELAYPTSFRVTLTLTEVVVRDDVMLQPIYDDIANEQFPTWDIRGTITRRDGQTQQQTFYNCVPDGSVDLMNLTPGEIVKRPWSFVSNATPQLITAFSGT